MVTSKFLLAEKKVNFDPCKMKQEDLDGPISLT